jgi:hypothetical protein
MKGAQVMNAKTKAIKKAIADFRAIETARDLKRERLTPAEYNELPFCLETFVNNPKAFNETISYNVAVFFQKRGFHIEKYGIGWKITI